MRLIFLSLLMAFTINTFGQQLGIDSSRPVLPIDYLKKSKHQNTAGWILTSIGTAGLVVTLGADMGQTLGGGVITVMSLGTVEPEYKSYTGYYLLSAACLGAGIAYFVAASKNKKRAASLGPSAYLKIEKAHMVYGATCSNQYYPAVALRIRLP